MQGARFESGLDNSPMYDGDFFNASVKPDGSGSVGQMELYDVGMASMFVAEAEALATLARDVLHREEEATMLSQRAEAQRKLISEHLWDKAGGIYTNKFWNGSFYPRISPTSFYSMLAGAASDEQAETMMKEWLTSPEHFCISPNGDFAGNKETCYWGLPSIQASDPAYPPLGYWRGYVWGPMAQLTYWSLKRYDRVAALPVASA
jgi:putative isomerase